MSNNQDHQAELLELGRRAKTAARQLAQLSASQKNRCLEVIADRLMTEQERILAANAEDLEHGREKGLNNALLDRLKLTPARIEEMARGLRALVGLPDPIGRVDSSWLRPNGLEIRRVRVSIGVIAIIYEARPNVTVDAAGLCLKAGNAVVLRGGSEAIHSNLCLAAIMQAGLDASGAPDGAVQVVPWTDHACVKQLLKLDQYIDLVIPRAAANALYQKMGFKKWETNVYWYEL